MQPYDLATDIGKKNVQAEYADVVAQLRALLEKYAADGRSTPGAPQTNTGAVQLTRSTSQQND